MHLIGFDIGGTKCAVSRLTEAGAIEETSRFPTRDVEETLAAMEAEAARLGAGPETVLGISCGGPLDAPTGRILSPPNLPGWDDIAVCDRLRDRFGCRAFLMNDANACALAEWHFGAGRGARNMVFLTMGTGMGAGLILDGRLHEGTTGAAGEVGHLRLSRRGPVGFGKEGSFEGFCSGGGIARLARMRLDARAGAPPAWAAGELTAKAVAEAAGAGEPFAREIMEEAGSRLGQALALLVDILNPERIVIGGIFPRCHSLLRPAMERVLREEALGPSADACAVVPAELGETIGSHGAISVALHGAGLSPTPR